MTDFRKLTQFLNKISLKKLKSELKALGIPKRYYALYVYVLFFPV